MTTNQENKMKMFQAVEYFLLARLAVLNKLPNFELVFKTFRELIAEISSLSQQPSFDRHEITADKKELKHALAVIANETAHKLHTLALFTNDQLLLSETRFTQTDLLSSPDSKLVELAKGIYDRAAALFTALIPYEITDETQSALLNAIDHFATSLTTQRLTSANSKMATTQLAEYFDNADQALLKIDALIEMHRNSDPNFYNTYRQMRKIVDYDIHSVALKGTVTDAQTNAPIKRATIIFVRGGKSLHQPPVVRESDDLGSFYVNSLEEGVYEVKLNKIGYKELITTSMVSLGKSCEINPRMTKI